MTLGTQARGRSRGLTSHASLAISQDAGCGSLDICSLLIVRGSERANL